MSAQLHLSCLLACCLVLPLAAQTVDEKKQDAPAKGMILKRTYDFKEAMKEMEYALYVPKSYDKAKKSPLIVALHGLGATPQIMMRYRGLTELAEKHGYVVVAPMGYNTRGWYGNRGWTSRRDTPMNLGELSEKDVMNVLDIVRKDLNIDPDRIYLMGHSMGGGGTWHIAIKNPDLFAALAPIAPAMFRPPTDLDKIKHVPVIVVQGDMDNLVPVAGTRRWVDKMKELKMTYQYEEVAGGGHLDVAFQNMPKIFEFFEKHNKRVVKAEENPRAMLKKTSYVYKTAGDVKISLDVHRADDDKVRPVVVWIHGGALVTGNRNSVPRDILELCRVEGYALASIDYRLAPEVKLPEIIADVEDAFRWIHKEGPTKCRIDPTRLVVTGGSAGGYLTLMSGLRVKPRPLALVAYWGYGDVDGEWYVKPSEHYRKTVALIEKDDAMKGVGGKVLTGSEEGFDGKARGRYYHYLRQNGLWTKEVTGFDPVKDRAKLDPYCPVRNVTADYPPTMLVHGTEDTDVPYELSAAMAKEFAAKKVPHELVTVKGSGHGLSGGDKKLNAEAHEKALAFIRDHLKGGK